MSPAESERGRLVAPDLDDRRWQDLVDEATALIDHYAPQWTDRSPSDPGITLVELFAWLVEGLIYRLNRVPEKNYVAFLNLLAITREPATPAQTLLTFTPQTGQVALVPAGSLAQTKGTESLAPVVFQTESELALVPAGTDVALRVTDGSCVDISDVLLPPVAAVPVALAPGESGSILLGFSPGFDLPVPEVELHLELDGDKVSATWAYSSGDADPADWPVLTVASDTTLGLAHAGQVRLQFPASQAWTAHNGSTWATQPPDVDDTTPPRRWLALKLTSTAETSGLVEVKRLLVNTVAASTALTVGRVAAEDLGQTTGSRQTLVLRNRPVFQDRGEHPYGHVVVTVGGAEWARASRTDEPGRRYRLDPAAGEITFGASENGELPPRGAQVTASYRHVSAGAAGNVVRGAIATLAEGVPGVIAVANPVPGTGGAEEEPIEHAKARAPKLLRTRDRAVTAEDYEFFAKRACGPNAIVRCLAPRVHEQNHQPWTYAKLLRAPGNVSVIVVPDHGIDDPEPKPSRSLILHVQATLDDVRDVTALVKVTGPRYLPIKVDVDARIFQRAVDHGLISSASAEYQAIRERIARFLHPIHGGPHGAGWQVGQSIFLADIYQAIKPDDRVGFIADLGLMAMVPRYHDGPAEWQNTERPLVLPTAKSSHIQLADYELICPGEAVVPENPLE